MTRPVRTHLVLPFAILALALGLLTGAPSGPSTRAEAATATSTSAAHPYGDPLWFPLRAATSIGCARSGCGTAADHGYWAIDFLGYRGEPVYAAGAGIAHVGGTSGACVATSDSVVKGRWVWIDHGAGVVTRYHHLSSITVHDGQLVTPATQIGTMGSSGDKSPCTTAYLHFEVRTGGINGTRVDPGPLRGCTATGAVELPQALGASGWDDPRLHPARRLSSPALTSSCVSPDWLSTPVAPAATVHRTSRAISVTSPALPAGATSWLVLLQTYHPTIHRWGSEVYRTVPAGTRTVTFGADGTHAYRAYVSSRGSGGWSAPSARLDVVGAPAAPRSPRFLSWKKSYVHYGWYHADPLGSAVTTFDVARRCATSGGTYGSWRSYTQSQRSIYRNLRGLSSYRRCEVKVRATNAVGTGPWSSTSTVRR